VFKRDTVDAQGWWHTALFSGEEGTETLWRLCEWVTGKGTNYKTVLADKRNEQVKGVTLEPGQRVLIPAELLLEVMKRSTPKPVEPKAVAADHADVDPANGGRSEAKSPGAASADSGEMVDLEPVDLDAVARELSYGKDAQGSYAEYRLKSGEALYTAVVVRFTDYRDNDAIQKACALVQERSAIKNVHGMKPGQRVLIPLDMLSDRFKPADSSERKDFEQTLVEAKRLRKEQVQSKELAGVVVIIDPGHGGRDQGAANDALGLYEDEINYDVACRVKKILETQTRAKVYMTMEDRARGYACSDNRRFTRERHERVLTTPRYENEDAKISANLRWYLANSIYRSEAKKGRDPRKIVFTSFHTVALFNSNLRGTMVYIPGAKYRRDRERPEGAIYDRFKEVKEQPNATSTAAERRRDEALSRNFAEDLMTALGKKRVRRHLEGDWIRSQIRQDGGRVYVPSVLRNTQAPIKILVETANMTNPKDCINLADPDWRQTFAEAYVDALKMHFGA
jgi:N-acetylmuramoyl-L-alanine amidase